MPRQEPKSASLTESLRRSTFSLGGEGGWGLRLDVAVEDALAVHVVDGDEQLVHVELDFALLEVVAAAADELVQVDVHELEDERESAGGLVAGRVRRLPTRGTRRGG